MNTGWNIVGLRMLAGIIINLLENAYPQTISQASIHRYNAIS